MHTLYSINFCIYNNIYKYIIIDFISYTRRILYIIIAHPVTTEERKDPYAGNHSNNAQLNSYKS